MTKISPHMYSGVPNPEMEISTEVEQRINELLCQATEPSDDRSLNYKMPPNGYFVIYPMVLVHVADGTICIRCFGTASYVKDTVGLERFLEETFAPIMQKHQEDSAKVMAKYYENLSRISKQEKV